MPDVSRRWIGVGACVVTALLIAVVTATVVTSRRRLAPAVPAAAKPHLPRPPERPFLMFISLASEDTFKRVVLAPLDAPDGARYVTALNCERVYSPQRWALTGEAGAFADPLYSPGSDFIGLGNRLQKS